MIRSIIAFLILIFLSCQLLLAQTCEVSCPIGAVRHIPLDEIRLTVIGDFGHPRKARSGIPAHLHSGIDIRRPQPNYDNEPVFTIYSGRVISLRNDGPFAQIIIEHQFPDGQKFWSAYEHVAGIRVEVGDTVSPENPIARFMNKGELDRFGWQFDHLHLEILKIPPRPIIPKDNRPQRCFMTYNLECYSWEDLEKYYYNPVEFMRRY